jgi:hypothetical protein
MPTYPVEDFRSLKEFDRAFHVTILSSRRGLPCRQRLLRSCEARSEPRVRRHLPAFFDISGNLRIAVKMEGRAEGHTRCDCALCRHGSVSPACLCPPNILGQGTRQRLSLSITRHRAAGGAPPTTSIRVLPLRRFSGYTARHNVPPCCDG